VDNKIRLGLGLFFSEEATWVEKQTWECWKEGVIRVHKVNPQIINKHIVLKIKEREYLTDMPQASLIETIPQVCFPLPSVSSF